MHRRSVVHRGGRDLFAFGRNPPIDFFLDREAGMLMLFDLLAAQAPDRKRLLESGADLALRAGAPLRRLAGAYQQAAGRVRRIDMRRAIGWCSPRRCREALERHYAAVFQLNHCAAKALASGWRFGAGAAGD